MGKLDSEASEMVFGVCKQIEGAAMRSKDVANEQKTETLALGLGREKRSEEILRYSRRDAMTIVGDGERSWRGDFKCDKSLCRPDTLHSILDDVDEHLLEKDGIKMNGYCFVGQTEVNMDVCLRTQVFEEGATTISESCGGVGGNNELPKKKDNEDEPSFARRCHQMAKAIHAPRYRLRRG